MSILFRSSAVLRSALSAQRCVQGVTRHRVPATAHAVRAYAKSTAPAASGASTEPYVPNTTIGRIGRTGGSANPTAKRVPPRHLFGPHATANPKPAIAAPATTAAPVKDSEAVSVSHSPIHAVAGKYYHAAASPSPYAPDSSEKRRVMWSQQFGDFRVELERVLLNGTAAEAEKLITDFAAARETERMHRSGFATEIVRPLTADHWDAILLEIAGYGYVDLMRRCFDRAIAVFRKHKNAELDLAAARVRGTASSTGGSTPTPAATARAAPRSEPPSAHGAMSLRPSTRTCLIVADAYGVAGRIGDMKAFINSISSIDVDGTHPTSRLTRTVELYNIALVSCSNRIAAASAALNSITKNDTNSKPATAASVTAADPPSASASATAPAATTASSAATGPVLFSTPGATADGSGDAETARQSAIRRLAGVTDDDSSAATLPPAVSDDLVELDAIRAASAASAAAAAASAAGKSADSIRSEINSLLVDMRNYYQLIFDESLQPDTLTYTALVSACCAASDLASAQHFLGLMRTRQLRPSQFLYTEMMRLQWNSCADPNVTGSARRRRNGIAEINMLFKHLNEDHKRPSIVAFNAILGPIAAVGDLPRLRSLYVELVTKFELTPNRFIYESILTPFAGTGPDSELVWLLGCRPVPPAVTAEARRLLAALTAHIKSEMRGVRISFEPAALPNALIIELHEFVALATKKAEAAV